MVPVPNQPAAREPEWISGQLRPAEADCVAACVGDSAAGSGESGEAAHGEAPEVSLLEAGEKS